MSSRPDRRFVERLPPAAFGIAGARLRPGRDAQLLNVSRRGALLESPSPLLPGSSVELQMMTNDCVHRARARVIRASVVRLEAHRVVYQGAVLFDSELSWLA